MNVAEVGARASHVATVIKGAGKKNVPTGES
jgi:hypothetical protein